MPYALHHRATRKIVGDILTSRRQFVGSELALADAVADLRSRNTVSDLWTLELIARTLGTIVFQFIAAVSAIVVRVAQPRRTYADLTFANENN